jgi:diguanylate cyclase (GGDEF)-like protein
MSQVRKVLDNLAQEMGISADDIALRKEFLEFSESDINLLREIHEHVASSHFDDFFTALFYHHLRAFPELRAYIPDNATLERLKAAQSQYFRRLTAGDYGKDYILDRLQVGHSHQRIGLEPKWYTGAYRKYLSFLLPLLHEVSEGDSEKFMAYYDALLKVVFFDMELALDTYFHSDRQELSRMANHDALTGLPNRYLLSDRIEQAIHQAHRDQSMVAILFIDLDRFKVINDSLGHQVGDQVISEVSDRFGSLLREGDTIARLGGDEFVVILADLEREEGIVSVAKKLLSSIEQAIAINSFELFTTASMGIAVYPLDGKNENELLKNADAAMYLAKQEGGNTFRFYRQEMNMLSLTRLNMEARLRQALKNQEFMLFYQPQVDLASGRIVGVEALLRWEPNGVMILPADFIALTEETGLIIPVGEWVLEEACQQVVAWHASGIAPIRMAVNISARQFMGQDIVETVSRILSKTGCKASWLELEITESAVMEQPQASALTLKKLSEMGIKISLDDFGTGYSSLAYLKQFPVDSLKIDRSFVQNIGAGQGDDAIIRAVIALADGLGIEVVGEGIEKKSQYDFLKKLNCDLGQGFYFSRPLLADEVTRLLKYSPVLEVSRKREVLASKHSPEAATGVSIMDISQCRVRKLDSHQMQCMITDTHCRFVLPFGNLCGHPLADYMPEWQSDSQAGED